MTMNQEVLDKVGEYIIQGEGEKAKQFLVQNIDKVEPLEVIEKGMTLAMATVGEKFEKGDCYLPEMIMAAKAFEEVMTLLKPKILEKGQSIEKAGIVVIGTVNTDIHEIGKNIVANMLATGGFEVHDLGADVPALSIKQVCLSQLPT